MLPHEALLLAHDPAYQVAQADRIMEEDATICSVSPGEHLDDLSASLVVKYATNDA